MLASCTGEVRSGRLVAEPNLLTFFTALSMSKEPSSNLESAMQMLIKTFHKYSGKEGDKYTLSRGELKELLLEELGSYLGNSKDNEAVEKVMNDLDANNDGEVDFTEFIILMGALTVACNDFFLEFKSDDKPKGCESAE
ncbi:S100 calcium binding protein S isoform X2 [Syngnathus acus]|uniref:S100 calcium binding protein S isoform X2 n=1 Tax=Syngnathus acus TaxID=161584 RepID=UPI0018863A8C|nr:S100 calcium binding protein S isoform X2 [Syngnathus acus]